MHIIILIKYIFGYVHVRIEGFFVERTMSQAINRKIFFWNVKKEKEAILLYSYLLTCINNIMLIMW